VPLYTLSIKSIVIELCNSIAKFKGTKEEVITKSSFDKFDITTTYLLITVATIVNDEQ
jgi:hypothetical protein